MFFKIYLNPIFIKSKSPPNISNKIRQNFVKENNIILDKISKKNNSFKNSEEKKINEKNLKKQIKQIKQIKEKKEEKEKKEKKEDKTPEDITNYIDINDKEYNPNYINSEKKITNQVIEEVDEAKEMSILHQQSDVASPRLNFSKDIKTSEKNELKDKNKNEKNIKYEKNKIKNISFKMNFERKNKRKFCNSSHLKIINIGFSKANSNQGSKKNVVKFNKIIKINNKIEDLIVKKQKSAEKKNCEEKNTRFKKIIIRKRDIKNKINLSNNKSNDNIKKLKEKFKIQNKYNNLGEDYQRKFISRTLPNLKNLFNLKRNKKYIKNGKKMNNSKKIKLTSVTEINTKRNLANNYKHKKILKSEDKKIRLIRSNNFVYHESHTYGDINKINEIKNMEEKFLKSFTIKDRNNRNLIKQALLNQSKNS